mmetsp:Transcript_11843/g.33175  ORF Transcript_11843/g.33175 Transcript_11843/m.33175 type:complete len:480 (-) Transcript_11843:66-1505(-)
MSFLCGLPICRNRSSASPVDTGAVPLPAGGELSKRIARSGSSDVMIEYVHSLKGRNATSTQVFQAGDHVSRGNVATDMMVVRGPDWKWENEDGGAGKPGRILSVSRSSQTATVHWQATGVVESHYRLGRRGQCDLCHTKGFTAPSRSKIMAVFRGLGTPAARNSQTTFADKEQTLIILDWDDTLFPSTFVRSDMHLKLSMPLRDQKLPAPVKKQVFNSLLECAANAEKLLRLCASYGKVVIVTLAKGQWVTDSCKFFYPGIGDLLKKLDVKIVYAQDGVSIDHDQLTVMDVQNLEAFWGGIKGKAISDEIKNFYSRYEGQSWKNIISIGDSNFEKIGTMNATADYMREKGIEVPSDLANISTESGGVSFRPSEAATVVVRDHAFHVRTKVAKMLDEPTVDELQVELELMRQWLPLMVKHDGGFSMDLDGLKGWEEATAIEQALREPRPAGAPERGPPRLLGAQGRSGSTTSSSPKAVSL